MTFGQFYTSVLNQIWRFMESVTIPGIGISCTSVLLGLISVSVAMYILRSLPGIASASVHKGTNFAKAYVRKSSNSRG